MRKYYLQESEWQGLEEDAGVSLITKYLAVSFTFDLFNIFSLFFLLKMVDWFLSYWSSIETI